MNRDEFIAALRANGMTGEIKDKVCGVDVDLLADVLPLVSTAINYKAINDHIQLLTYIQRIRDGQRQDSAKLHETKMEKQRLRQIKLSNDLLEQQVIELSRKNASSTPNEIKVGWMRNDGNVPTKPEGTE